MKTFHVYCIDCLTSLQLRSNDDTLESIDMKFPRDPANSIPMIPAFIIKGTVKNYFESKSLITNEIFKNKNNDTQIQFLNALLLTIPVRSNDSTYYQATSEKLVSLYNALVSDQADSLTKIDLPEICISEAKTEFGNTALFSHILYLGEKIALLPDIKMQSALNNLPIIVRNSLHEGFSLNLYYEELIPRHSKFYFGVLFSNIDMSVIREFDRNINGCIIQIGSHGASGHGFCRISRMG